MPGPATTAVRFHDVDFVVDPRSTVLTSLIEFFGPFSGRLPPGTVTEARRLARRSAVPELCGALWTSPYGSGVPDFLGMAGAGLSSFADQVELLRETPEEQIHAEVTTEEQFVHVQADTYAHAPVNWGIVLDAEARRWRLWKDQPTTTITRYCQAVTTYRKEVLDRLYPSFERRLQREVHRLSLMVEQWGPELVLNRINPRITAADGTVSFRHPNDRVVHNAAWAPSRVVVRPMISAPETVMTNFHYRGYDHSDIATLSAPTGDLGVRDRPARYAAGLDVLLGPTRSKILAELRTSPGSTTDLANALGYVPSTVSHHLKTLTAAGIVDSHRTGLLVCYHLTDRGTQLLALYSEHRPSKSRPAANGKSWEGWPP